MLRNGACRRAAALLLSAILLLGACAGCAGKAGTDTDTPTESTQPISGSEKSNQPESDAGQEAKPKNTPDKSSDAENSKTESAPVEERPVEESAKKIAEAPAPEESQPLPEPQKQQEPTPDTSAGGTCTVSVFCGSVLENMDNCRENKKSVIPDDGVILADAAIDFTAGETAFDVTKRACQANGISLEFSYTPIYGSYYIEGIGNLYEFDVGDGSGWMFTVNGMFPGEGCSRYVLQDGDSILWLYTCGLGTDIGGGV